MRLRRNTNKYGAIPTQSVRVGRDLYTLGSLTKGYRFASRAEEKRFRYLFLFVAAGDISDLKVHPRYPLIVNGIKVSTYTADFSYLQGGRLIVEDVKSAPTRTEVYKLRKNLMKALYNIEITEVLYKI